MPYLVIKIANKGTEVINPEYGDIESSVAGHIWYSLVDDNGLNYSYGFNPKDNYNRDVNSISKIFSQGNVFFDDDANYILGPDDYISDRVYISEDAFQRMKDFGGDPGIFGFEKKDYNVFNNSCIDFVWKALAVAGFNSSGFQGDLVPAWNINNLEKVLFGNGSENLQKKSLLELGMDIEEYQTFISDYYGLKILSSSSLENFLTKYNFNQSLSDYANIIPSLIVNDGNGGNFNLAAFPNFSDLVGIERTTAWDNFTNSFLETALTPFDYDLDQFTDFLNSNRISFSEFESDLSDTISADESGTFSSAFDSYFTNSFFKESGLDSDLFKVSISKIDGEGESSGNIVVSDEDLADYSQPIPDPDLIPVDQTFTFSAEEYFDLVSGSSSYFDRFADMSDFEEDLNRIQEDYLASQNNLFADLNYEQRNFVEEFDDALQQLIAENPANWQDLFADFSLEFEREWDGRMSNLISIHESAVFSVIDDYQKIYYSPETLEVTDVSGSLKSEFQQILPTNGLPDWDFDPVVYEDGYIEGFGYYEMKDAFYIGDTNYSEYWEYFDSNSDNLISEEEFDEDWDLFYDLYGDDESFYSYQYAFDYEAGEFSEYWSQFDEDGDGLISEDEFGEDYDAFVSYLEDAGYYEARSAFEYDSIGENGAEYFEQFDYNGDGLVDEYELEGDFSDYLEWTIDNGDGWLVGFNPYDEINWEEYWLMSDWSPWATPEDAFYSAYAVDFDEYVFFDEDAFEGAFSDAAVSFEPNWVYVEDYYDMSEYWDLEIDAKISGFETDYSAALFDQFISFNSWKLDLINSWQDNQSSFEVSLAPRFNLDPFFTHRQIFDEFGFVFDLDDSLYLPAPVTQSAIEDLSSEQRQFVSLSTESFVSNDSAAKLISANASANQINLGGGDDIVESGKGNDTIFSGAGNDILIGEEGDDFLQGGSGDDVYVFNNDFGNDVLSDDDGAIIINNQLLAGIANQKENNFLLGQASLSMSDNDLLILEADGNSIRIKDFENGKFGITLNHNPENNFENADLNEDNAAIFDVLANASDADGDGLEIASITQPSNGFAEIVGGKIKYIPNENFSGQDSLRYLISDGRGGFLTKELTVMVNAINDAPIVVSVVQNQAIQSDKAFTYQLPNNLFSDVDGDNLTISATLVDGSALPSWLSFDGVKFSGNPTNLDVGILSLILTATDSEGAFVSQNFNIEVAQNLVIKGEDGDDIIGGGIGDDTISAGNGNDWIESGLGDDVVDGNAGNDIIYGGDGDDDIRGSNGNDTIYGGSGKDTLNGGADNDVIHGDDDDDFIDGALGDDILYGDSGSDKIYGNKGNDKIYGGIGDDTILGNSGNDVIYGGDGDDNIDGNQDNDVLYGEEGDDQIRGGIGDDLISGGSGSDTLIGAVGMDVFYYEKITDSTDSKTDIILDFIRSEDKIDLSTLGFDSITQGQGSNFSANGLEFYFKDGYTIIDDPNSNFAMKLAGDITLNHNDFVL